MVQRTNIAVLVVASDCVVELVLSNQLECCRSKVGQSKEKVDDFHFVFFAVLDFQTNWDDLFVFGKRF